MFPIFGFGQKHCHTTIKFRSFKTLNVKNVLMDLQAVPWSIINSFEDINDAISTWYTLFLDVVNMHVPLIEKS